MAESGLGGDTEAAGQVPEAPKTLAPPQVPQVQVPQVQVPQVQVPQVQVPQVQVPEVPHLGQVPQVLEVPETWDVVEVAELQQAWETSETLDVPQTLEFSQDTAAEEIHAKLAEPAQRLVGRIIDMFVVGLPVVLLAQALLPRAAAETVEPVVTALLLLVYDSLQHVRWGRTPGKRLTGTRVVTVTGEPLGLRKALLRAAVYAVPIAARPVPILGVVAGIVWVGGVALVLRAGRSRQALHDQFAGTVVVSVRE